MGRITLLSGIKRWIKGMQDIVINVNSITLAPNELLKGKNAIITGAGSGIGYEIASAFISSGATVVALGRNAEKLKDAKNKICSDRFIIFPCDISEIDNISSTIQSISNIFENKKIDILVNCAGVKNGNDERFFEFTPEEFDFVMRTNIRGIFFWCQEVARHMINNDINGHIVNVASIKGFIGESSPYSVSKWGCVGLTKGLGRLLAPKGIVVNGIAPGGTRTPMAKEHASSWLHLATPSMRLADPKEIANLALFLASDMGNNIIGETIISDGGQTLQYGNNRF
jgi:3-oxoacyl-[acyl-carrier protein] reductase